MTDIVLGDPIKVAMERLKADGYGVDAFDHAGARGRWGRAIVKDASDLSGPGKLYQRPSTKAKMLDDSSNLVDWKAVRVLVGASKDPSLLEEASRYPDPDDPAFKDDLKFLANEAASRAGADTGRDYGSLVHALIEAAISGADWQGYLGAWDDRPLLEKAVESFFTAMATGGFDITHSEVAVVNEKVECAGSTDGIAVERSSGQSLIFDVKTTKPSSLRYSWLSFGLQLWTYAHADCIYDPATGERSRLPENFDRSRAMIAHVDWKNGTTTLYVLDLDKFGEAMDLCQQVEFARGNAWSWAEKVKAADPVARRQFHAGDHRKLRIAELVDNGHGELLARFWPSRRMPLGPDEDTGEAGWMMVAIPLSDPSLTVQEYQQIDAALTAAEKAAGRHITKDQAMEVRKQVARLPEDLQQELKQWWASTNWNDAFEWTKGQYEAVTHMANLLTRQAVERAKPLFTAIAAMTLAPDLERAILVQVTGKEPGYESLLPRQLAAVKALIEAAQQDLVVPVPSGEGVQFLAIGLAKLTGLTKTAKPIAAEWGWPVPKKVEDVQANPVLAALCWRQLKETQP